MTKGFVGFEVKEDISELETTLQRSIHPFISLYEFDFDTARVKELAESLETFKPTPSMFYSQYKRMKKRFSNYGKEKNTFWYGKGKFVTAFYLKTRNGDVIIPATNTYLTNIMRPILIHGKLNKKESYPFWILDKYQRTKKYNYIKNELSKNEIELFSIPKLSLSLDELGVFVEGRQISSVKLL